MAKRRNYDIKSEKKSKILPAILTVITITTLVLILIVRINPEDSNTLENSESKVSQKDLPEDTLSFNSQDSNIKSDEQTKLTTVIDGTSLAPNNTSDITYNDKAKISIIVDGWSYNILGSDAVKIVDVKNNTVANSKLSPLSEKDFDSFFKKNYKSVAQIIARLYPTKDAKLKCDNSACFLDEKKVNVKEILYGSTNPIQEQLKANKVKSPIYFANFNLTDSTSGLNIVFANQSSIPVSYYTEEDKSLNAEKINYNLSSSPEYGFGIGSFPVGFAFGKPFLLDSPWSVGDGTFYANNNFGSYTKPFALEKSLPLLKLTENYKFNFLSDSELNYRSSPATNCGGITICSISTFSDLKSEFKSKDYTFCDSKENKLLVRHFYGNISYTSANKIYNIFTTSLPEEFKGLVKYNYNALYFYDKEKLFSIASSIRGDDYSVWDNDYINSLLKNAYSVCK